MSILPNLIAAAIVAALLVPATGLAQDGDEAYRRGLEAFRAQQYETALAEFTQARDAGVQDPNLVFNLGLTHYRLRRYDDARKLFLSLLGSNTHTTLATYQLGMIAARIGDVDAALAHFLETERLAEDPALRTLARTARQRLAGEVEAAAPFVYLHAGLGHDSNPALLNDALSPLGETERQSFMLMQGLAQWGLGHDGNSHLQAGFYLHEYLGRSDFDQAGLHLRWHRHFEGPRWHRGLGLGIEADMLDGDFLQALAHLEASIGRRAGPREGALRMQATAIRAGDGFDELDGWRLRAGGNWGWFPDRLGGLHRVGIDLSLELNDRHDLHVLDQFFSQSPRRIQSRLEWRHPAPMGGELDWTLRWRHSRYPQDNRPFLVGTASSETRRRDDLLSAGLLARWPLARRLSGLIDYRYDRNRSSLELFDYGRHMLTLGVEWVP